MESSESDAVEIEPKDPDTYVLLKSVEGMMDLIQTQAEYYNDARKRLVDEHLKKPALSISSQEPIYIDSSYPGFDISLLRQKLGILAARLKQMSTERADAQKQTEAAFKQLNAENQYLREELTRLRREYMIPKDDADPDEEEEE